MKDKVLLDKLRVVTTDAKRKKEESKIEEEEKLKKIQRDSAKKEAEKMLKNFEKDLLQAAEFGHSYHVVDVTKSKNPVDWDLRIQEAFKILQEKCFEPEIRERKEGDMPKAYPLKDAPYFIIVSWEE